MIDRAASLQPARAPKQQIPLAPCKGRGRFPAHEEERLCLPTGSVGSILGKATSTTDFWNTVKQTNKQTNPLRCVFSGHDRGLQFAGANWSGPPRTKEKTKRRCKGPSDMSMPMPKNVARRAGAKIQNQREPTSCVRLIWRCFSDPKPRGGETRKPCLTPAHPSSRELNIYTK
jgi:hypothetical protein